MLHEIITDDDGVAINPWLYPEKYPDENGVVVRDYAANPDNNGRIESRVLFVCPQPCVGPDGDGEPEDGLPHSIYFAYEMRLPCPDEACAAHRSDTTADAQVIEANYKCHYCDWNAAEELSETLDRMEKIVNMALALPKILSVTIDDIGDSFEDCDCDCDEEDHDATRDELAAIREDATAYADATYRRWHWLLGVLPGDLTCSDDIATATGHIITASREFDRLRQALAESSSLVSFAELDGQ
jgi:hypothetical protein